MRINTAKIYAVMAERNLSVTDMAAKAGISRQTLSTILPRKTCNTTTLGKIARALEIEAEQLIAQEA